jgi:hypothetical protein
MNRGENRKRRNGNEQNRQMNKTGIGTAPILSKEMIESSRTGPVSPADSITPADFRAEYIKEGQTIGSVPPPTSMKGMAKSALQALKDEKPIVFIDKLAELLAFERTGTRLYEMLIQKAEAIDVSNGRATVQELERICREELNHFHLLWDCIEKLGADPTGRNSVRRCLGAGISKDSKSSARSEDDFRAMPRRHFNR